MNTKIKIYANNIIVSIERAFQYISYTHTPDFINAMLDAYFAEENLTAKNAIWQILENSKLSMEHQRPLCQDTGIATIFCKIGSNVEIVNDVINENPQIQTLNDMLNEGVRRAYSNQQNPLRYSVLQFPASERINTKDNTPAIIHYDFVNGDSIEFICAAKGGGSEAKAKFAMLNPSDSVEQWILQQIPKMGAGWCPPGILGVGIGGTPEKAMLLAKQALMQAVSDKNEINLLRQKIQNNNASFLEKLRISLLDKINNLGIGAQGLGGLTTLLDVKILDFPTHAANLPVAIIPNCAATRHCHFALNSDNKIFQIPTKDLSVFERLNSIDSQNSNNETCIKLNLDDSNLNRQTLKQLNLKIGQKILLSGKIYTARDAAHKRLCDLLVNNQALPINLDNKFLYYVGPVDPVNNEIVGSAGPTTATRMDKFMEILLSKTQLLGSIGKAERSIETTEIIKKYNNIYLIAVGGAAYLISQSIKSAKVVAFEDLGMEAIYEFVVEDFPVIVAVDSDGNNIHQQAPQQWQKIIISKNKK